MIDSSAPKSSKSRNKLLLYNRAFRQIVQSFDERIVLIERFVAPQEEFDLADGFHSHSPITV